MLVSFGTRRRLKIVSLRNLSLCSDEPWVTRLSLSILGVSILEIDFLNTNGRLYLPHTKLLGAHPAAVFLALLGSQMIVRCFDDSSAKQGCNSTARLFDDKQSVLGLIHSAVLLCEYQLVLIDPVCNDGGRVCLQVSHLVGVRLLLQFQITVELFANALAHLDAQVALMQKVSIGGH